MSTTDKFRNKVDKLSGRVRQLAGEALGDRRMAGEGRRKQVRSDLRDAGEKVKDAHPECGQEPASGWVSAVGTVPG